MLVHYVVNMRLNELQSTVSSLLETRRPSDTQVSVHTIPNANARSTSIALHGVKMNFGQLKDFLFLMASHSHSPYSILEYFSRPVVSY